MKEKLNRPPVTLIVPWIAHLRLKTQAQGAHRKAASMFASHAACPNVDLYNKACNLDRLAKLMDAKAERNFKAALKEVYGSCWRVESMAFDRWVITTWPAYSENIETMLFHKSLRLPVVKPRKPVPLTYQEALDAAGISSKQLL